MDLKNAHKETARDLVKGMAGCEREFRYAIAKDKIPRRTNEQEQIVKRMYKLQRELVLLHRKKYIL